MKILFDYQIYVEQNYGGISRYFYELSKGLIKSNIDITNSVCISNNTYTNDSIFNSLNFFPDNSFKGKKFIMKKINETYSKYKIKDNYSVFHPTYYDTYFLSNLKNKPFVITFYDLIHEKFKDLNSDESLFNKRKLLLEKSTEIIAISNSTKKDIIDIYKIPSSKIHVVHLANSINSQLETINIPYSNYILYVGNRNNYKNFLFFIESIAPILLKEKALIVLCAGGGILTQNEVNLFNALKIREQIIQVSINDTILATLYKKALFFVFPSLYEGFGIPILEAFSCSCPALLSNTSSLPEVGGDAAIYFDPNDKNDILNKVMLLLYDDALKERLKIAGLKRQSEFSWEQTVEKHIDVYRSIL